MTYEAIQQNALKPYEEQRDNLEIMHEHKQMIESIQPGAQSQLMIEGGMSNALVATEKLEDEESSYEDPQKKEELRKLEMKRRYLAKFKVVEQ